MVFFVFGNFKIIIYYLNNNKNIINEWFKLKEKYLFILEVNFCCVDIVYMN